MKYFLHLTFGFCMRKITKNCGVQHLYLRMTSTTDDKSRAKEDSLDILRAEVEELKRQRYAKAGPVIPLRLTAAEDGRDSFSTRKENERTHQSGVRKKTSEKDKLPKHNVQISKNAEEGIPQDTKNNDSVFVGARKETFPEEGISRDPIDLAQMELMEFEDAIVALNEEIEPVLERKSEKERDQAGAVKIGDKKMESSSRLMNLSKMLSLQSTDTDEDSSSLKLSVEFSELHQRVADLLTKNEALERQIVTLKRRVRSLQQERLEILKINYMWEEQHVKVSREHEQAMKDQEEEIQKLHRQLSKESKVSKPSVLEEKDAEIMKLKQELRKAEEKIASMQNDFAEAKSSKQRLSYLTSNLEHMHAMLEEEKKEKEFIVEREKHSQQQIKAMESIIGVTEAQLNRSNTRRKLLEDEVKRLAKVINENSDNIEMVPPKRTSNYCDEHSSSCSRELSNEHKEQVELLKHQIITYKEDFKCEREEKEKVIEENKKLKVELRSYREKIVTLQRQAAVYENSFRNEREERIRLMRLTGQLPPDTRRWEVNIPPQRFNYTPYFDQRDPSGWGITARSSSDPQSKELEYAKLAEEREQIMRRMHELEMYNVDRKKQVASQEQGPRSPGGLRRGRNEVSCSEDLVPDSYENIPVSSEKKEPLSPKFPNACPRCGLSPQSKKEFVTHFETCDRS